MFNLASLCDEKKIGHGVKRAKGYGSGVRDCA